MILSTPVNFSNIDFLLKIINTNIQSSILDIANTNINIDNTANNIYILPNNRSVKFLKDLLLTSYVGKEPLIISAKALFPFNYRICESIVFNIMQQHMIYKNFAPHKIIEFSEKISKYIEDFTLNNCSFAELNSLFYGDISEQNCCCDILRLCYDNIEIQKLIKSSMHYYEYLVNSFSNNNLIFVGLTELNAFLVKLITSHESINRLLLILNEDVDSASYKMNNNILNRLNVSRETIVYSRKNESNVITYLEFDDNSREAFAVSCLIKNICSKKKVLIVSPNEVLSKKIKNDLQKFNIVITNSIGDAFSETKNGLLSFLVLNMMKKNFNTYSFINLLKHDDTYRESIVLFEMYIRKKKPTSKNIVQALNMLKTVCLDVNFEHIVLNILEVTKNYNFEQMFFSEYMKLYFAILNIFDPNAYADNKWLFKKYQHIYQYIENISMENFYAVITKCIFSQKIHISTKSNITLLGPIEAQLIEADYIIVTSADENNWTSSCLQFVLTANLAKKYHLPLKDSQDLFLQSIFEKLISKQNVIITRAINNGESSQPYKMLTFKNMNKTHCILNMMKDIECYISRNTAILLKSEHIPPINIRPRRIAVSDVLSLLRNPYAFYAKKILNLRDNQRLSLKNKNIKGIFIHEVLDAFVKNKQYNFAYLLTLSANVLKKMELSIEDLGIWYFAINDILKYGFNTFDWHENDILSETRREKKLQINDNQIVTIECIADRIDINKQNYDISIIDYKTGNVGTQKSWSEEFPQLPLEGFIYDEYVYQNVITKINNLYCIQLKNNALITHEMKNFHECEIVIENAIQKIKILLEKYLFQLTSFNILPEKYDTQYTLLSRAKEFGLGND